MQLQDQYFPPTCLSSSDSSRIFCSYRFAAVQPKTSPYVEWRRETRFRVLFVSVSGRSIYKFSVTKAIIISLLWSAIGCLCSSFDKFPPVKLNIYQLVGFRHVHKSTWQFNTYRGNVTPPPHPPHHHTVVNQEKKEKETEGTINLSCSFLKEYISCYNSLWPSNMRSVLL